MTDTRPAARDERARGAKVEKRSLPARISLFYRQVVAELRKVIWPTRKELVTYTTVVIFFVCLVILYVTTLDVIFSKIVLKVFG
jgi:preprotein translocase subunit SecE